MKIEELNWEDIQKFYDDNHTWKDIINKYNVSSTTLNKARKIGKIISSC